MTKMHGLLNVELLTTAYKNLFKDRPGLHGVAIFTIKTTLKRY